MIYEIDTKLLQTETFVYAKNSLENVVPSDTGKWKQR